MRGLEVILFMLCIIMALPLVAVLAPMYNNGYGVDTGATDFTRISSFNFSSIAPNAPTEQTNPFLAVIDQASYYFKLAVAALQWIATLIFSGLWAAPGLLELFAVNSTLVLVLLTAFGIILLLAWMQIAKGDDWSGRR